MARLHLSLFAALALLLLPGCATQKDNTPRTDLSPLPSAPKLARLAPDFTFRGAQVKSLRGLRGQAVVLVLAESPRTAAFRKQLRYLEEVYSDFASRQVVFIAAFTKEEPDNSVKSNVPFAIANNGSAVAAAYGFQKGMNIAVIGKDGNLDYQTPKVIPGERVRDVIQNSFAVQTNGRH